jgi:hypothetical protein
LTKIANQDEHPQFRSWESGEKSMPNTPSASKSTTRKWSPHAFAVTVTWGICVLITALGGTTLIGMRRFDFITWQNALTASLVWCGAALSVLMLIAVRAIHRLEHGPRADTSNGGP